MCIIRRLVMAHSSKISHVPPPREPNMGVPNSLGAPVIVLMAIMARFMATC